ncbi:uncharacterized protein RJT21DRAFT_120582 [Scheffersomyces amazonensis]|uniref:uncharacterized protein n=1 Tax=Scheffersomyces amazonensis TaxID=1078765 RepID=UPI00315DFD66
MFSSQESIQSRKRSAEEEDVEYGSDYHSNTSYDSDMYTSHEFKKLQRHKIHSELHYHSIQVLLDAQRQLNRLEKQPEQEHNEVQMTPEHQQEAQPESQYHQKPFWPQLNKLGSS